MDSIRRRAREILSGLVGLQDGEHPRFPPPNATAAGVPADVTGERLVTLLLVRWSEPVIDVAHEMKEGARWLAGRVREETRGRAPWALLRGLRVEVCEMTNQPRADLILRLPSPSSTFPRRALRPFGHRDECVGEL